MLTLRHVRLGVLLTAAVVALGAAGLAPAAPAGGAGSTWYVAPAGDNANSCSAPDAPCATLNGVIAKAADGDTIRAMGGTYRDNGPEAVLINKSVTLTGGWDTNFAAQSFMSYIDGQMVRRSVTIPAGVTVTIEHFTIHGGAAAEGPGVYNAGTLTLNDSEINANWNSAMSAGKAGGLFNLGAATLRRTSVFNNKGNGSPGGGIYSQGQLTLISSAIVENSNCCHLNASGGGLFIFSTLTTTINNSTISGNVAGTEGGGLTNAWSPDQPQGPVYINNSTIVGNWGHHLGGIFADNPNLIVRNSLIANNNGGYGYAPDCGNTITSAGHNLIGISAGCYFTPAAGDILDVNPGLGAQVGLPAYLPLLAGSPALDAGDPAGCRDEAGVPLSVDIRGVTRPKGAACDIGAYEAELTDLGLTVTGLTGPIVIDAARTFTATVTNSGPTAADGVVYTQTLSAQADLVLTPSQGTCAVAGSTAQCDLGRLEVGAQADITVLMTVTQSAAPDLASTSGVVAVVIDQALANNVVTLTVPISPANLTVTAAAVPDLVFFGAPLTYTVHFTNTGPALAAGVVFSDLLPADATVLTVAPGAGTCTSPAGGLTCAFGDLAPGAGQMITFTVTPGLRGAPAFVNTARVFSRVPQTAPDSGVITTSTAIVPADLSLTLNLSAASVKMAAPLSLSLIVTNAGPAPAGAVQVDLPWPAGLALQQSDFGPGACALNGGGLRCTLASLNPGASQAATLHTQALSSGDFPLTATVTANEPDPAPAGNTAGQELVIEPHWLFMPSVNSDYCPDFADDFSDSSTGWPQVNDALRLQGYTGAEYRIQSRQAGYLLFASAPSCPRRRNVVGVDTRWEGQPGAFIGLRFAVTADASNYLLFMINTDFRVFTLLLRTPTGLAQIAPILYTTAIEPDNAVNRVEAWQQDSALQLRVNGITVWSDYYVTYPIYGRAGLVMSPYDDAPAAEARFDNFVFRRLIATDIFYSGQSRPAEAPAVVPARLNAWLQKILTKAEAP